MFKVVLFHLMPCVFLLAWSICVPPVRMPPVEAKKVFDSLGPELQMVMRCYVGAGS